jgi:hypothetical protein
MNPPSQPLSLANSTTPQSSSQMGRLSAGRAGPVQLRCMAPPPPPTHHRSQQGMALRQWQIVPLMWLSRFAEDGRSYRDERSGLGCQQPPDRQVSSISWCPQQMSIHLIAIVWLRRQTCVVRFRLFVAHQKANSGDTWHFKSSFEGWDARELYRYCCHLAWSTHLPTRNTHQVRGNDKGQYMCTCPDALQNARRVPIDWTGSSSR